MEAGGRRMMRVDELSSLVRLRRRTEEDSLSRPIMRHVWKSQAKHKQHWVQEVPEWSAFFKGGGVRTCW